MKFSFSKKDPLQKSKWEKLHNEDYHLTVAKIVDRINEHRQKNIWLFDEWSDLLGINLDLILPKTPFIRLWENESCVYS